MPTTSIDDLLMGGKSPAHPQTPEHDYQEVPDEIEELEVEEPEKDEEPEPEEEHPKDLDGAPEDEEKPETKHKKEYDDYGNEKEPENEAIRDRLARQARKHQAEIDALRAQIAQQNVSQPVQQAVQDFEYDPEARGDWQQQLAAFVKQTVASMGAEQEEKQVRARETQAQQEFESKFREGVTKFHDFADVINELPFQISNPMTLATRGMSDPAAFLYAAAKRNPGELERISKLRDPYAQMTEMGRLEERMRKNKPTTTAPRPLSRSTDDGGMPIPKKNKETSIEDLIAKSEQKKMARMKGRPTNRR